MNGQPNAISLTVIKLTNQDPEAVINQITVNIDPLNKQGNGILLKFVHYNISNFYV